MRRIAVALACVSTLGAVSFRRDVKEAAGEYFPDFLWNVWVPGREVWHGEIELVSQSAWTGASAVLFSPFTLPPYWLAVAMWTTLSAVALVTALRLVGCRDNLALCIALLSPPSLACLVSGNVSLLLVFAIAVMWACRDRPWALGAAFGLALAVKVWLWPLAAFLVLTRRWRALGVTACWVAAAMLAWWLVSPETLGAYPERSEAIFEFFSVSTMGVVAALTNVGVGTAVAQGVATALGLAALAVAWRVRGEAWVFGACVTAALLAAPLLWTHYYAVLLVPIAMLAPRLSWAWLAPFLTVVAFLPPMSPGAHAAAAVLSLASIGTAWWLLSSGDGRSEDRRGVPETRGFVPGAWTP